jgi:cytochrome b6-f complex iron-sulfur subunit
MPDHKIERRNLLKVMCGGAAAVCGGVMGCGAAGDMVTKEELVQLPAVVEGRIRLDLAQFPMLQVVGGGLVGEAQGMVEPLAIARDGESSFFATRAVCSHMTCTLRFNRLNATLDCPCHGSTFEFDGQVINGPATKNLNRLTVEFDGQTIGILI